MIYISHRGNLTGKNIDTENSIIAINECLNLGYNVEIDVWFHNDSFWLGHDEPQTPISEQFLENTMLWCHAKNNIALFKMLNNANIHCFWHQNDSYTITSKGFIWAFPGEILNQNSICVLPETDNFLDYKHCYGICSDQIEIYRRA